MSSINLKSFGLVVAAVAIACLSFFTDGRAATPTSAAPLVAAAMVTQAPAPAPMPAPVTTMTTTWTDTSGVTHSVSTTGTGGQAIQQHASAVGGMMLAFPPAKPAKPGAATAAH